MKKLHLTATTLTLASLLLITPTTAHAAEIVSDKINPDLTEVEITETEIEPIPEDDDPYDYTGDIIGTPVEGGVKDVITPPEETISEPDPENGTLPEITLPGGGIKDPGSENPSEKEPIYEEVQNTSLMITPGFIGELSPTGYRIKGLSNYQDMTGMLLVKVDGRAVYASLSFKGSSIAHIPSYLYQQNSNIEWVFTPKAKTQYLPTSGIGTVSTKQSLYPELRTYETVVKVVIPPQDTDFGLVTITVPSGSMMVTLEGKAGEELTHDIKISANQKILITYGGNENFESFAERSYTHP